MLPTFVIGLREGLEATLLVGIVGAFLARREHRRALPRIWIATAIALAISLAVGIALQVYSADLAPRPRERFEAVIGFAAVAIVTWMIVHLRAQMRDVTAGLEATAASTFERGSEQALVVMVFFGVLREGLEIVVFALAAFQADKNAFQSGIGVVLGLVAATVVGLAVYKGGLRVDLHRFFRITGVVLVLIAAGLVMTALQNGYEGALIRAGQQQLFDLTWLVAPGSIRSSIITGTLGIQPSTTRIEALGWLLYVVPMSFVVAWPTRERRPVLAAATDLGSPAI
jgi:high-affinity iron transporter